jgi:glucose/arabinose dehydrogenase
MCRVTEGSGWLNFVLLRGSRCHDGSEWAYAELAFLLAGLFLINSSGNGCCTAATALSEVTMAHPSRPILRLGLLAAAVIIGFAAHSRYERLAAQAPPAPEMLDRSLEVRTVVAGLTTPIALAFLGRNDMLVLEKNTGQVKRVVDGVVTGTVLDLGVNNSSERGLLGIALHPRFPRNPGVYLFWTCRSTGSPADPFFPDEQECLDTNMFLPDSDDILQVPLLGNRVDRFVWNGTTLAFDRRLITLRAFQNDAAPDPPGQGDEMQPARGNHNGGVIRFGPDGKLYIQMGDNGRRGQLQNLPDGPGGPTRLDDQFGGPEPDDAHLTGVILRLNDDGTAPGNNPFFRAGARMGGEIGRNIQKIVELNVDWT